MQKRDIKAQTTVLIIVAIAIVAVIAVTFFITNNQKKAESEAYFSQSSIKPELNALTNSFSDCADKSSKDALTLIGIQGGYYNPPVKSHKEDTASLAYYYYEGQMLNPSQSEIENELSKYVDENIDDCISNLQSNFEISLGNPSTKVSIREKEVQFNINMGVKISKESYTTTYELKDSLTTIPSELNAIIDLADYITESHKEDPELYCISCVSDMAEVNNLYVNIDSFNLDSTEMMITIYENHTSSEPYSFIFLNKYTGDETSPSTEASEAPPIPQ